MENLEKFKYTPQELYGKVVWAIVANGGRMVENKNISDAVTFKGCLDLPLIVDTKWLKKVEEHEQEVVATATASSRIPFQMVGTINALIKENKIEGDKLLFGATYGDVFPMLETNKERIESEMNETERVCTKEAYSKCVGIEDTKLTQTLDTSISEIANEIV